MPRLLLEQLLELVPGRPSSDDEHVGSWRPLPRVVYRGRCVLDDGDARRPALGVTGDL